MDASAYLVRHGWLGLGHPLNSRGRGIKKPLLASKKSNVLGVGKKKNDAHADQWWARAFDASLKSLDVSGVSGAGAAAEVHVTEAEPLSRMRSGTAYGGRLYDGFVKGQSLGGTIAPDAEGAMVKVQELDVEKGEAVSRVKKREKKRRKRRGEECSSGKATECLENERPASQGKSDRSQAKEKKQRKKRRQDHLSVPSGGKTTMLDDPESRLAGLTKQSGGREISSHQLGSSGKKKHSKKMKASRD